MNRNISADKGKCSKISNTFLFLFYNKMLVFRAGIQFTKFLALNCKLSLYVQNCLTACIYSRCFLYNSAVEMQFHHILAFWTNHFTTKAKYHILGDVHVIVIPWLVRLYFRGLSYVPVDKHGIITILYHLHQCRPCTS